MPPKSKLHFTFTLKLPSVALKLPHGSLMVAQTPSRFSLPQHSTLLLPPSTATLLLPPSTPTLLHTFGSHYLPHGFDFGYLRFSLSPSRF
ncbi:hypothetical protein RIF29_03382 [Crotalaria pallida]|uniref:Uncharacterized protein n=1 Tax=Crotalaria pallida TaxID=3830 RepID=A0AAN9P996_CROPI